MEKKSKILVAGASGLVGSAICRELKAQGYTNVFSPAHKELDLLDKDKTDHYFQTNSPEFVFLAAAKVGGIYANNTYPVDFLEQNLRMQLNVISCCHKYNIKKLLFMGSSCIYPKLAHQPMSESELLNGKLEETNQAYAIAKIAGIVLCQSYRRQFNRNYISVMPTNLYGYNDNYHPENSHVIPALIRRFHESKIKKAEQIAIWGTGRPLREFLFSDDLAQACLFLMHNYNSEEIVNVGSGQEVSIQDLALLIGEVVGYQGKIVFDTSKPDGTPRKLLDSKKINAMGWSATTTLRQGLTLAYQDFQSKSLNNNGVVHG